MVVVMWNCSRFSWMYCGAAPLQPQWVLIGVKAASKCKSVSVRNETNAATGCIFHCVPVSWVRCLFQTQTVCSSDSDRKKVTLVLRSALWLCRSSSLCSRAFCLCLFFSSFRTPSFPLYFHFLSLSFRFLLSVLPSSSPALYPPTASCCHGYVVAWWRSSSSGYVMRRDARVDH